MYKKLQMPEVSIITPCYNSSKFLKETIDSVLNQTFTDWEWLITDDCSQDDSAEIIKTISDPRIILHVAEKNGGAGHARNISLRKASGRFITFLDADDFWNPEFLEEMVNFMKKENAELAYSNYARCDENLNPIIEDFKADKTVTFENLLKTCRLSLLSSMYDSKRVGIEFFPEGSKREDHVMWLNLLKKISEGKALPKTMAKYRMHASSISRKKQNIVKDQYLVYKDFMKFSTVKSLYYTANWAFNGFLKYSKIFN
ncbi:Glycosyltransferase involved in cell wall bisynthesis [Chryseobacterium piscicola]|uniref:Glycosyltransferase involved in cell wall bisynthesis n=2 Tax=Chryseobacterium piscicola TaxID=551459 RepID=A0A1N7NAV9_9FLAO|nr:Glycosyltransferase involved in cell wall bisynthesis [Chryseobacterium piscicola]